MLEQIDEREDFCGSKADIGIIVFDGGVATGIRVLPPEENDLDPFGEGKVTLDRGFCCNGLEYYYSGVKPCENPGTALTNDLEFFHDYKEGKLYLYCEGGNPSERFDEIKVGCNVYTITGGGDNVCVDNIAARYSTWALMDVAGKNVKITNCEAGWSSGGLASVDGSIGGHGTYDGYLISNCYGHDIGDGCTTHQHGNPQSGDAIKNVTYENNIFVCSGGGIETWMHMAEITEDGRSTSYLENIVGRNNIMAYMGYGVCQKQARESNGSGGGVSGSIYGEYINCSIEDNLILFTNGYQFAANTHTDNVGFGWNFMNNTYVGYDGSYYTYHFETFHMMLNHNMQSMKKARVFYPYNERYIKFYTSQGIDTTGKYYVLNNTKSEAEERGCYYINGYYLQRGIYEIKG